MSAVQPGILETEAKRVLREKLQGILIQIGEVLRLWLM